METMTGSVGRELRSSGFSESGSIASGPAASPLEIVEAYASAKSSGDIDGALAVCHPEATIETLAFQAVSRSAFEARVQFENFLKAADY
jgi:hypothetical protein